MREANPGRDNQVEGAPLARVALGYGAGGRFVLVDVRANASEKQVYLRLWRPRWHS